MGTPPQPPRRAREVNPRMLRLGSVRGVPVYVTPSWLLIAGFITISYSGFMQDQIDGLSQPASYALALLFAVALALSVLAHELGHTIVSRLVGLQVRRIVVFLLGGVSEIEGETLRPRDEFVIAAAGPAVSFVLAAGCWVAGTPAPDGSAPSVMLTLLAWSNLVIGIFNVLPGLPLDGGRLLQAVVWQFGKSRYAAARVAAWSGRILAVLIGLGALLLNSMMARGGDAGFASFGATAIGLAIALFLWFGASQTLRVSELNERASRLQLGPLIRPAVYLPPNTPISEAVRQAVEARAAGIVIVDAAGRSRGIVRESDVAHIDPSRRPWLTVADVSRSLEPGLIISETTAGDDLLRQIRTTPASEYLVIGADGVTRGVVATADLARALGVPQAYPAH